MQALALLVLFFGQYFAQDWYDCDTDPLCSTVATGLHAPRHLATGGGNFYVAESGAGGDRSNANGNCFTNALGTFCLGYTGGITRVSWGDHQSGHGSTRILIAPSVMNDFEPLGVAGLALVGNDIYFTVGFGVPPDFGPFDKQDWFGTVRKLSNINSNTNGRAPTVSLVANIGATEQRLNPDHSSLESNAFGICQGERNGVFYVTDAAGNCVYRLQDGALTVVAVLPDFIIDGQSIDFVPTQVRLGRDGHLYVSSLVGVVPDATGVHVAQGAAKIVRIRLDTANYGRIEDFATGFTNIIDFDFTPQGEVLVCEISHTGFLTGFDGAILRVSADGQTKTALVGADSGRAPLFAPGGIQHTDTQFGFIVSEGTVSPTNGKIHHFNFGGGGNSGN